MRTIRRVLAVLALLAVVALVLFFVLENQQPVALALFGWSAPSVPAAVVVLGALIVGLALGPLLGAYVALKAQRRARKLAA